MKGVPLLLFARFGRFDSFNRAPSNCVEHRAEVSAHAAPLNFPISINHLFRPHSKKGRFLVPDDDLYELPFRRLGSSLNGRSHTCDRCRPTGGRRMRQGRVPQLRANLLNGQSQAISANNRQYGPGSGAQVLSRRRHLRGSISLQPDLYRRSAPMRRIQGRGHPHPDQPVAVSDGAWLRIPLGPSELLRAKLIALDQILGRPRHIFSRKDLCIILCPQFDRINAELHGKLVHGAFESKHSGSASWSPHECRASHIPRNQRVADLDVRRLI